MDKTQEALKLALEALKQIDEAMPFPVAKFAQSAIREALAEQSAHESAYQRGYMDGIAKGLRMEQPAPPPECRTDAEKTAFAFGWWKALEENRKQPAAPQRSEDKKQWVGLTDDDLDDIAAAAKKGNLYDLRLVIEAKLREKNAQPAAPQRSEDKKQWVGLTSEQWFSWWQVSTIMDNTEAEIDFADFLMIALAVQDVIGAKLREKNA